MLFMITLVAALPGGEVPRVQEGQFSSTTATHETRTQLSDTPESTAGIMAGRGSRVPEYLSLIRYGWGCAAPGVQYHCYSTTAAAAGERSVATVRTRTPRPISCCNWTETSVVHGARSSWKNRTLYAHRYAQLRTAAAVLSMKR
jgi:hypothetical protein